MPVKGPRVRMDMLIARDAPVAVILRRGPRLHFHLALWNLKDDTIEHGQWMKGTVRLWDLSPKGDKLVYWARQWGSAGRRWRPEHEAEWSGRSIDADPLKRDTLPNRYKTAKGARKVPRYMQHLAKGPLERRRNEGIWTAVSTPPFFSALAIWPSYGHWTGGGCFADEKTLLLIESKDGMEPKVNVPIPRRIKTHGVLDPDDRYFHTFTPSATFAWPHGHAEITAVQSALEGEGVEWFEFAIEHQPGELIFACDGRLYRLPDWRTVPQGEMLAHARCVADFRDLTFTQMKAPPEAMRW